MEKKYHKNVLDDLTEFKKNIIFNWETATKEAAKEWSKLNPSNKKEFENFYIKSAYYMDAMATYNAMGKKLRLIEKIYKIIKSIKGIKTIVDFGCGIGSDSLFLDKCGYKVIAMDLDSVSLDFTKWRIQKYKKKIKVIAVDKKIPKCDLILSLDTLEHVFDPYETLKIMIKSKPKILLFTTAFRHHDDNQGGIPMHTDYDVKKLEKFIEDNGYRKKKLNIPFPPRLFIKKLK